MSLEVKFRKLNNLATTPKYSKPGDACMDLTAVSKRLLGGGRLEFNIGIALEIPPGYVGLIFPRSSIRNTDLYLSNSVGVIDSGYRGPIKVTFNRRPYGDEYQVGDRVAQLMIVPYPQIRLEECDELSDTERSVGGHGSTGR